MAPGRRGSCRGVGAGACGVRSGAARAGGVFFRRNLGHRARRGFQRPCAERGSVSSEARTTGFPVTIDSALGQAVIAATPRRVVTLGLGADDLALALGVVPVGTSRADWGGDADHYWPWVRAAIQAQGQPLPERSHGLSRAGYRKRSSPCGPTWCWRRFRA